MFSLLSISFFARSYRAKFGCGYLPLVRSNLPPTVHIFGKSSGTQRYLSPACTIYIVCILGLSFFMASSAPLSRHVQRLNELTRWPTTVEAIGRTQFELTVICILFVMFTEAVSPCSTDVDAHQR